MSILALDIGNSRIGLGIYEDGKSVDAPVRIALTDLAAQLPTAIRELLDRHSNPVEHAALASVVPSAVDPASAVIRQVLGMEAQIVGRDIPIPLEMRLKDSSTVGVDRLLGALTAFVNTQSPCAIISCGTALVVDCIDAEGVFRGGAIAPGLSMAAQALHANTAQLPLADLTPPDGPTGLNTMEALNLGLYAQMRGAVRYLLELYADLLGTWPHVVATGGDAQRVLGESELVDSFIPDLVLQGVALVCQYRHQPDED
jgi:type III pantothenate kinase